MGVECSQSVAGGTFDVELRRNVVSRCEAMFSDP